MTGLSDFDSAISEFMKEFGTAASLLVASTGTYDVATSAYVSVDTEYQCRAIFLDLTLQRNGLKESPNTLVQEGDKLVYVQPLNKTDPDVVSFPTLIQPNKDRLKLGTKTYKIVTMKQVNPTMDNAVVLELYVRE